MTWAPLLLADPSPCLRMLVLRELLGKPADDPEVQELAALRERDPLVTDLLALQHEDGSFGTHELPRGCVRPTAQALMRLGYLAFGPDFGPVRRGAEFIFSRQQRDGSWDVGDPEELDAEARERYTMLPLRTAIPLRALASCGYATDPRAERAYDWLLAQRLDDGAWPAGIAGGNLARIAGYRRLPHSRWGCRSNTTGALICLALHPERRRGEEARRALDLLLGRETRDRHALGFEAARTVGFERAQGTFVYYARFDPGLVLDLCRRVGATLEDARVAGFVEFVRSAQGEFGLWDYAPKPEASRWVTFDLLRSLAGLDEAGDWVNMEPRTPFQSYPKRERRY